MCDHSSEKLTRYTHPAPWGDFEEVFVCECGESWDHDPALDVDLDAIDPEFEADIKQVCPR